MPPHKKRGCARLPGGGVEPSPRLQGQRARLAHDGAKRTRLQSLLHDAQNFGVLPAIDPDDAASIEAEAGEPRQIAIAPARSPQERTASAPQNTGRHRRGETCHGGCEFSL